VLAAASLELKAEKKRAHSTEVYSVAFSPDGKTIVSGSAPSYEVRSVSQSVITTLLPTEHMVHIYTLIVSGSAPSYEVRGSIKVWDAGVLARGTVS